MSCPEGTICLTNTSMLIFSVIIVACVFIVYQVNLLSFKNIDKIKNNYHNNNESLKQDLKKDFNINVELPPSHYRMTPDYNNKYYKRTEHPLYPPEKTYDQGNIVSTPDLHNVPGLPINIKTRGYGGDYQQIGILYNGDTRLPLYGRRTYRGSNQWNYYTASDSNNSIKIPVTKSGNKCTDERGCQEINENDDVNVSTYDNTFKAEIYSNDGPRYIPYI